MKLSFRIFKQKNTVSTSLKPNDKKIVVNSKTYSTKPDELKKDLNIEKHGNHSHEENDDHDHEDHEHEHIHACCHHDINDNKFDWKHPLVHCAKISLYIFIVNLVMGGLVALIGEDRLISFLSSSSLLQPLFALIVGLIPNCASSVVLTELYMLGGLSFGAIVTGLSVNAGIGILVLFKQNKNLKENLFIIAMLIIPSLIVGYALHFVPFNFLRI